MEYHPHSETDVRLISVTVYREKDLGYVKRCPSVNFVFQGCSSHLAFEILRVWILPVPWTTYRTWLIRESESLDCHLRSRVCKRLCPLLTWHTTWESALVDLGDIPEGQCQDTHHAPFYLIRSQYASIICHKSAACTMPTLNFGSNSQGYPDVLAFFLLKTDATPEWPLSAWRAHKPNACIGSLCSTTASCWILRRLECTCSFASLGSAVYEQKIRYVLLCRKVQAVLHAAWSVI